MKKCVILPTIVLCALSAAPVLAASHQWVINEIFSNPDGTVQFVEMYCPVGANGETFLGGKDVFTETAGSAFGFPANITGPTGDRYILLATAAFAALPGAPTPDHIISEDFFDLDNDMVKWHVYHPQATLSFTSGELPLDGVTSLERDGSTGQNSPTNYAGESGTVDASAGPIPTASEWGLLAMTAMLLVSGIAVLNRRRAAA